MIWLTAAASLALVELTGAALLTLLCGDLRRWSPGGRAGLAFGLGLIVLSIALFFASLASALPGPWIGLLLALVLWTAAALFRRSQVRVWLEVAALPRSPRLILVLFLVGLVAVVGGASVLEPLVEWDVIAIWALKAQVVLDEPVARNPYFRDLGKAYSHLDYPLLWPFSMAWVWSFTGAADLQAIKLLGPCLLAAVIASMAGLLRRWLDEAGALLFAALLAGTPMLLSQSSRLMADVPLALFVVVAFGCSYLWLEQGRVDDLRVAAAFVCGMLFVKNEGLALWGILVAGVCTALLVGRAHRRLLPAISGLVIAPLLVTAPWFWFRTGIPKVHENYAAHLISGSLWEQSARLPEILSAWPTYLLAHRDWLILWPLVFAGLAVGAVALRTTMPWFLALSLLAMLALDTLVYVVTPWRVDMLMDVSAARLLLQLAPLAVLTLAITARRAGWIATKA